MSNVIGDPRPAGDQRPAGEAGPAGDPRPAGEAATGTTAQSFDPSSATVAEVQDYLADADDTERERVIAAEKAGKGRVSITG